MVNIVSSGAVGFDAGVYVPPAPETVGFIQQNMNRFREQLMAPAQNLYATYTDKVSSFDYQQLGYMLQAVGRTVDSMWMDNVIQPLHQIGHLQHAPQVMVRWLMAEPTYRQLYHNGEAEGYGERYYDRSPNDIGQTHHDWQVVMDGVVETDEDGIDYSTDYFYDSNPQYDPEYDELNVNDTANIIRSWQAMAAFASAKKDDPGSAWNGQL